tara:strand:+ start:532 stop:909 length:378 start_codon:yes stop_codon:yes gene_type:complete
MTGPNSDKQKHLLAGASADKVAAQVDRTRRKALDNSVHDSSSWWAERAPGGGVRPSGLYRGLQMCVNGILITSTILAVRFANDYWDDGQINSGGYQKIVENGAVLTALTSAVVGPVWSYFQGIES